MSFLDNSGDIILDAVLTDTGRKRMAAGNFTINKFALGDDEINYQLYNKDHPSGSAYYDLEILQTPVLEGRTMKADINYGLLDITNQGLLYMPALKTNPPPPGTTTPTDYSMASLKSEIVTAQTMSSGVYWVATDETTYNRLVGSTGLNSTFPVSKGYGSTLNSNQFILFEQGIDNSNVGQSQQSRTQYIVANNMEDTTFTVSANALFIATVYGLSATTTFTNNFDGTTESPSFDIAFDSTTAAASGDAISGYNSYSIRGVVDGITGLSKYSVIAGARGTAGGLQFLVAGDLIAAASVSTPTLYHNYGKVNAALFAGAPTETYDYIDTVVYVKGDSSSMLLQLPIRIIRINT